MKALIRNPGETVTEADSIPGINWNTGMPLTNPVWAGGPYQLVDNYVEVADYPEPEDPADDFVPTPAAAPAQDPPAGTIVIDGVTYTRRA